MPRLEEMLISGITLLVICVVAHSAQAPHIYKKLIQTPCHQTGSTTPWRLRLTIDQSVKPPLEFVYQEQSYSSLHFGRSLAWDHFCGNIADPCAIIADFCGVIANPCGIIADP